jgi:hypothetical protein
MRVKPLEWKEPGGKHSCTAEALGLVYRASEGIDDPRWELRFFNFLLGTHPDRAAAIAAADEHFAGLVLKWVEE